MKLMHCFRETGCTEAGEAREAKLPETPEQEAEREALSVSEDAYEETVSHVQKSFGPFIPEAQMERIEAERENGKPELLSAEQYHTRFPEASPAVLGHYDAEGKIWMKEGSPEVVHHVVTHEALHLSSFNERVCDAGDRQVFRSGIRELTADGDAVREDRNRALNEGITELYTMRELQLRGEMTAYRSVSVYPEAQRKAYELQGLVGSECIRRAYFGGELEALQSEVVRLNGGDETAWERYSKNVDILEYGTEPEKVAAARQELNAQQAAMWEFKDAEAAHSGGRRRA